MQYHEEYELLCVKYRRSPSTDSMLSYCKKQAGSVVIISNISDLYTLSSSLISSHLPSLSFSIHSSLIYSPLFVCVLSSLRSSRSFSFSLSSHLISPPLCPFFLVESPPIFSPLLSSFISMFLLSPLLLLLLLHFNSLNCIHVSLTGILVPPTKDSRRDARRRCTERGNEETCF